MGDNPRPPLILSPDDCRAWSHALADVLCWFSGFAAARPNADLPPGINLLRDANIKLKGHF